MGRKMREVVVSDEEFLTLRMLVNSGTTEQRLARRARVILASLEASCLEDVCRESGFSIESCLKWRRRFMEDGLDGLSDRHRSGRRRTITGEQRAKVIALACSKPEDGSNQWSVRRLAKRTGLGSTTVHRILNEGAIKPHKVEHWCGKSKDPEFEAKQAAILGLYLDPPDNALVLAVDEKSQIQALDRTQPALPLRMGNPKRLTASYKRHGTTCLLAALSVHEGSVEARCVDRHTHREFMAFLKHLYRTYPRKELHLIMDNFSAHKHKKVIEWASRRRRLTIHFTPTYASWLNQVEIWFSIFSKDVIKGGVWHSKRELIKQIMHYIKKYNEERSHPFSWTYTGKPLTI